VPRPVLLIHADPNVVERLRGALTATEGEWTVTVATSAREITGALAARRYEVVVADASFRGFDGRSLLDEIALGQPAAVRLVFSESEGRGMLLRADGSAHQHLSREHQAEAVFALLARTLALGDLLHDEHLKRVVARLVRVPSLPTLYLAITAELRRDEASGKRVGELVAKDAGMTAKVLQLVNSPFFGLRMTVTDPVHAVQLLGLETVRGLVLTLHIFAQIDERTAARYRLARVWRHSLATSACARTIAHLEGATAEVASLTFTAALLHDIGKLVLATSLSEDFTPIVQAAERDRVAVHEVERQALGTSHAEIGAYLLGVWGLPEPVVEAVAWHHRPSVCPSRQFCPLGAVHVANVIEHEAHPTDIVGEASHIDEPYLSSVQLAWKYPAWKAACLDAVGEGLGEGLAAKL